MLSAIFSIQSSTPFWPLNDPTTPVCTVMSTPPIHALKYHNTKNSVREHVHVKIKQCFSYHTHTHTLPFNGPFPGLPRWAGTRKVKLIWILLKQETVSGSGISWAICKSAPRSRQITTPAPHHSVFYRLDALPAAQTTASKHWRHNVLAITVKHIQSTFQHSGVWW